MLSLPRASRPQPSYPQPSRRRRPWLAGLLVAAGLVALVQGGWIQAKAWLAQELLESSWRARVESGERLPPWPWADTLPVARLEAPRLGVEQLVLDGSSGRTLAFGPGWVPGTAAPGRGGHGVVGGHRDTHFAFLQHLVVGDRLEVLAADGRRHDYRVEELRVADVAETWLMAPTVEDRLTLVTCWPFDALTSGGRGRYVVRAVSVKGSAPTSSSPAAPPGSVVAATGGSVADIAIADGAVVRAAVAQAAVAQTIRREPLYGNWLGDSPRSTMLQPTTALTPRARALASSGGVWVPGLNHTSSAPAAAISSSSSSTTGGGR